MKVSILASLGVTVNAQAEWSEWMGWSACSATCSNGNRIRFRVCLGSLNQSDCGGPRAAYQQESCNEGTCPWWGRWAPWSDCSEQCGGGVKARTRDCIIDPDWSWGPIEPEIQPVENCSGSSTDEELCNQVSCEREMIFWNNQLSNSRSGWIQVTSDLPDGDTMLDRCSSYCLALDDCKGMAVSTFRPTPLLASEECYINDGAYTSGPNCWGSLCDGGTSDHQTIVFGVFKDYYETNPEFLPTDDPDGELEINLNDLEFTGICNGMQVANDDEGADFGFTKYRATEGVVFETDDKNVVREDGTADCGPRCFLQAGCKAFYTNDDENTCTMIFNPPTGTTEAVAGVGDGGVLTPLCENISFNDQVSRTSQLYCLLFSPDQSDEILQRVIDSNGVGLTALNTWRHEILNGVLPDRGNPYVVQSQYMHVTFPDNDGTDARYRWVNFKIETHIRVGRYGWAEESEDLTRRKRRSSVRVGVLTEDVDRRNHKQQKQAAASSSKKQRNEGNQEFPLEEVLALAIAGEKAVTDAILGGGLNMPDGLSVAATGPIELISFVQRTDDGAIAADCTESDCTCGQGFIDNGDGCVEMTEEQAATTEAPTTSSSPTTSYSNVVEYLPSLVDKMNDVFEENRPSAGRKHLSRKWENLSEKFLGKYSNLVSKGCSFSSGLENTVNFDTVNTCRDINRVTEAFAYWGSEFTIDCTKEDRGTHDKWFNRHEQKLQRLADKTRQRVGC